MSDKKKQAGASKGDFIAPEIENEDRDERADALPLQEDFWKPPVRFGSVPVEKEPLGWDRRRNFRKVFPPVQLPFQVADRISFGYPELEPNRLFWGDNLHVMRSLPAESIDLIYIDPPFFSGRHYNVIFGDKNELRSFSDIWEGGMPGYLVWLNARLFEMKRLLKRTGSIYVHCDHHASHYIKVELDKIFGYGNFLNEVVWPYTSGGVSKQWFGRKHDVLLLYAKQAGAHYINIPKEKSYTRTLPEPHTASGTRLGVLRDDVCKLCEQGSPGQKYRMVTMRDVWGDVRSLFRNDAETIGYPTQKPERLLRRVIEASCPDDGVVGDFFVGGGTSVSVAQMLNRKWVACDQSRVATAITRDRLVRQVDEKTGKFFPAPDFTIEHWGVYEAKQLSETPPEHFRGFVLRAFGATEEKSAQGIHGYKGAIPIWVGAPEQTAAVTVKDVQNFANAIRKTTRYKQDNLRDGIMLAWAFGEDAQKAAAELRELGETEVNFVRLDMLRIDSHDFRKHIAALSTTHADYENFLTFVQPPKVEVGYRRVAPRVYAFDVSDTVVLNSGAQIANVQWDFNYEERFSSTPDYSFAGGGKEGALLKTQYQFPTGGKKRVACKVQDDMGGEGFWTAEMDVE